MHIFKLSIFITGIALFTFGCAGNSNLTANNAVPPPAANAATPAPPPATDDLAAARPLFKENCARCHQANGEGGKVSSDIGDFTVPSFKRPSVIKEPDSEYLETIVKGEEEMPAFKDKLSDEQIKSLIKFIRKEFQGQ